MSTDESLSVWNNLQEGLKTYCSKNGFNKVILGLSGGIDSALVAVLAADALGGENVMALMMKTKYTSNLSLQIAREIAKRNNLNYQELDIEQLCKNEFQFLTGSFGQPLKDIVQENLQARIRGQILMAYSNQFGSLVLACGNKSEALTGYCTLYGDTCGGLMPIGNLYKTTVFELAKWRNLKCEVLPKEVINRAPSAELKYNQKDENTLPPYPVLDAILKELYDNKKSVQDVVKLGFEEQTVSFIQKLINRSSFKRHQMAASLML